MTTNELRSILESIPQEILIYGNSSYSLQEVLFTTNRVDINFYENSLLICFIKVLTNSTIHLTYFEDEDEKPEYKDCFAAMNNTKIYLELLGFKIV